MHTLVRFGIRVSSALFVVAIDPGVYRSEIGYTNFAVFCNGPIINTTSNLYGNSTSVTAKGLSAKLLSN